MVFSQIPTDTPLINLLQHDSYNLTPELSGMSEGCGVCEEAKCILNACRTNVKDGLLRGECWSNALREIRDTKIDLVHKLHLYTVSCYGNREDLRTSDLAFMIPSHSALVRIWKRRLELMFLIQQTGKHVRGIEFHFLPPD